MSKKDIRIVAATILIIWIAAFILSMIPSKDSEKQEPVTKVVAETVYISESTTEEPTTPETTEESTTEEPTTKAVETTKQVEITTTSSVELPMNDVDLLALITMAEAEGESEYGKRLVIDTILNRVDSDLFPDTVYGVIYQKGQFSPVTNGRLTRCYVREDIRQLVIEELESRTNYEVLYFNGGGFPSYGTPLFQEGSHYFSTK